MKDIIETIRVFSTVAAVITFIGMAMDGLSNFNDANTAHWFFGFVGVAVVSYFIENLIEGSRSPS